MTDKINEIRERHLRDEPWRYSPSMICPQAHDDRALLLAEVDRQRAEIERLRADNERLRTVYVLIASSEEKIIGCYISREAAEGAAKLLMADWRIEARDVLEGKP